ncbi:hypothetical protein A3Q56_03678 [Intoshia linei]|uniref:Uncharacterized protein n=1 Tax=Intoshia linei TaxID=1819745 RepID=A0A177B2Y1_9BILA|nr:hypothetical protein A3Q56_03678 [Intoshia linei]
MNIPSLINYYNPNDDFKKSGCILLNRKLCYLQLKNNYIFKFSISECKKCNLKKNKTCIHIKNLTSCGNTSTKIEDKCKIENEPDSIILIENASISNILVNYLNYQYFVLCTKYPKIIRYEVSGKECIVWNQLMKNCTFKKLKKYVVLNHRKLIFNNLTEKLNKTKISAKTGSTTINKLKPKNLQNNVIKFNLQDSFIKSKLQKNVLIAMSPNINTCKIVHLKLHGNLLIICKYCKKKNSDCNKNINKNRNAKNVDRRMNKKYYKWNNKTNYLIYILDFAIIHIGSQVVQLDFGTPACFNMEHFSKIFQNSNKKRQFHKQNNGSNSNVLSRNLLVNKTDFKIIILFNNENDCVCWGRTLLKCDYNYLSNQNQAIIAQLSHNRLIH